MALTLCSNCRLPVNVEARSCPLCGVVRSQPVTQRHGPLAAATIAIVALALVARRLA